MLRSLAHLQQEVVHRTTWDRVQVPGPAFDNHRRKNGTWDDTPVTLQFMPLTTAPQKAAAYQALTAVSVLGDLSVFTKVLGFVDNPRMALVLPEQLGTLTECIENGLLPAMFDGDGRATAAAKEVACAVVYTAAACLVNGVRPRSFCADDFSVAKCSSTGNIKVTYSNTAALSVIPGLDRRYDGYTTILEAPDSDFDSPCPKILPEALTHDAHLAVTIRQRGATLAYALMGKHPGGDSRESRSSWVQLGIHYNTQEEA